MHIDVFCIDAFFAHSSMKIDADFAHSCMEIDADFAHSSTRNWTSGSILGQKTGDSEFLSISMWSGGQNLQYINFYPIAGVSL